MSGEEKESESYDEGDDEEKEKRLSSRYVASPHRKRFALSQLLPAVPLSHAVDSQRCSSHSSDVTCNPERQRAFSSKLEGRLKITPSNGTTSPAHHLVARGYSFDTSDTVHQV